MQARISITLNGKIGVFVDEGTYEEAEELARKLYTAIGQVTPIEGINPPEQHRHAIGVTEIFGALRPS